MDTLMNSRQVSTTESEPIPTPPRPPDIHQEIPDCDSFPGASGSIIIPSGSSMPDMHEQSVEKLFQIRLRERLESVARGEIPLREWSARELVPEFFEGSYPAVQTPVNSPSEERIVLLPERLKAEPDRTIPETPLNPYNVRIKKGVGLRSNRMELKLGKHIRLPDEMFCPSCGTLLNYVGKCEDPSCEKFGSIIDREKFERFQKEVEEYNLDVMGQWEAEMRRLGGT